MLVNIIATVVDTLIIILGIIGLAYSKELDSSSKVLYSLFMIAPML